MVFQHKNAVKSVHEPTKPTNYRLNCFELETDPEIWEEVDQDTWNLYSRFLELSLGSVTVNFVEYGLNLDVLSKIHVDKYECILKNKHSI